MRKSVVVWICLCICICLLTACGASSQKDEPVPDSNPATTLPLLENDTAKSPLGLYGDTVFGIVTETNDTGMILTMQNQSFLFAWTDKSKSHYEKLGIQIGDEVGVPFTQNEDGSFIADDVELVMTN